jgi:hypothetical protein
LKDWSPTGGALQGGGNFKSWGLAEES